MFAEKLLLDKIQKSSLLGKISSMMSFCWVP